MPVQKKSGNILNEPCSWNLHEDAAAYCSEQILKTAPHKIVAAQLITFHLTNILRKTNKTGWVLLKNQELTHK